MKTMTIVLALALLGASGAATATAFADAPRDAQAADNPCSDLPKFASQCAVWVLRCVGDSLGGNACHHVDAAPATAQAGPDVEEIVECTKTAVRNYLQGTPQPCSIGASAQAEHPILDCVGQAVRNMIDGVTPEPCTVEAADPGVVECVKYVAGQVVNGRPILPCAV